jgi:EpsI family protein
MSVRARLALLLLAFLLPPAALGAWSTARGKPGAPVGLAAFPRTLGGWSLARVDALSAEEREMLAPDAYLAWQYEAAERLPVSLYVALYDGPSADGKGAHDPALCYPASGWEVTGTRYVPVPLRGGGGLTAKLLVAQQGNSERMALYWFQPAGRWPGRQGFEQLARIGDALAGRQAFAFVRLSAPVESGRDAEQALLDFAAEAGWPVRRALAPRAPSDG